MSEFERIVDQLERAYRGEAWHGPSIREVLDGVDADAASARPVSNGHTIKELVVHVLVWEKEAQARLAGKGRDDLPPEDTVSSNITSTTPDRWPFSKKRLQ